MKSEVIYPSEWCKNVFMAETYMAKVALIACKESELQANYSKNLLSLVQQSDDPSILQQAAVFKASFDERMELVNSELEELKKLN